MTSAERRSSIAITLIYAFRMLGIFLVLPVFALETRSLPGGNNALLVGIALGGIGLTQAIFQTPFGIASDRFGRKRTIAVGLLLFIAGSIVCALSTTMAHLIIGRCLQGTGAISAATTAMLSDQTRAIVRTKALALVGISIAIMFSLSLVIASPLTHWLGFFGLFWVIAILGVLALLNLIFIVPKEVACRQESTSNWWGNIQLVFRDRTLRRLNFGVFILHATQLSMWMAVPDLLVRSGILLNNQWHVYLPAVILATLVMGSGLFRLERKGYQRGVYLAAIALMGFVELALLIINHSMAHPSPWLLATVLFLFFTSLNSLEALQPSWVSRQAPKNASGAALGIYNSLQSVGLFMGGFVGGILVKYYGASTLFGACTIAMIIWLFVAWQIKAVSAKL
jgi:MFS family permease